MTTLTEASKRLNQLLGPLFMEMERDRNKAEEVRAKADPLAHKKTRVMANTGYRYWNAGRDGRGSLVLFCWSSHRNVAGFFLGWRQTQYRNGKIKRDMWVSRRRRKRCIEIASVRRDKFRERHAKPEVQSAPPV